jgi:hypothetical protein
MAHPKIITIPPVIALSLPTSPAATIHTQPPPTHPHVALDLLYHPPANTVPCCPQLPPEAVDHPRCCPPPLVAYFTPRSPCVVSSAPLLSSCHPPHNLPSSLASSALLGCSITFLSPRYHMTKAPEVTHPRERVNEHALKVVIPAHCSQLHGRCHRQSSPVSSNPPDHCDPNAPP